MSTETEQTTDPLDGDTVRWFATGLLRHELSHPEQERAASLLMRLYDRGKGNESAASDPPPVAPPHTKGKGISYAIECNEAASVLSVLARGETYVAPHRASELRLLATTAAALRALAGIVAEAEKAQADLVANVSTQGDAVYEYEMTCHALVVDLAAGFSTAPPPVEETTERTDAATAPSSSVSALTPDAPDD